MKYIGHYKDDENTLAANISNYKVLDDMTLKFPTWIIATLVSCPALTTLDGNVMTIFISHL